MSVQTKKKKKPNPIKQCAFTSSHGADNHFFPQEYTKCFEGETRFEKPEFLAQGGAKIDDHFVANIKSYLAKNDGERNLVILIVGGNNIRKKGDGDSILPHFEKIVELVTATERAHVLICGLVPSPPHEETFNSRERFSNADKLLSNLASQNEAKCTFFPTANKFCSAGKSLHKYYEKGGKDVHLNRDGAELFAKHLSEMVRNLPKEKFNFSQKPKQ